jgi:hypothetical protein
MRNNYSKVKRMADGGDPRLPNIDADDTRDTQVDTYSFSDVRGVPNVGGRIAKDLGDGNKVSLEGSVGGFSEKDEYGKNVSELNRYHRLGYSKELEGDREIGVGVSGYGYKGERGGYKFEGSNDLSTGDVHYRSGDTEVGASYTPEGKRVQITFRKRF